jgi:hypothetical protein
MCDEEDDDVVPSLLTTAKIMPFPVRRRQRWVREQLARAATLPNRSRDLLTAQVNDYSEHLRDLGVAESVVNREVDDLAVMLGLMSAVDDKARA